MRTVNRGWAFKHRELGLLGRYGFLLGLAPLHMQGYITAVFPTRQAARGYLRERQAQEHKRDDGFRYWLDTRVVRVTVTVKEDG